MSGTSHIHIDDIIVDSDVHFTIDTTTRMISNQNADKVNKKLTIMQYDNKSERYSFDIDRKIDGHDLTLCNRVQIHFINIGSNKQKNIGLYLVDDVKINPENENKVTFSWLISSNATQLSGVLGFLVSFECVDGDTVLYRWSSSRFDNIQVAAGMDNDNTVIDLYVDELLSWQNTMETEVLPALVDEAYVERDFATSEEVAAIFDLAAPVENFVDYLEDASVDNGVLTLSKNDGSTVEFKPSSNPNLLINADFSVNQRGVTSLTGTNTGYMVDKWRKASGDADVSFENDICSITVNTAGLKTIISQTIEFPKTLIGKKITFSLNVLSTTAIGTYATQCSVAFKQNNNYITMVGSAIWLTETGLLSKTFTIPSTFEISQKQSDGTTTVITYNTSDMTELVFSISMTNNSLSGEHIVFKNPKIEVGEVATPFSPKPYVEELADCQRYYQLRSSDYTFATNPLDRTPQMVNMTGTPGTTTINGTTYKYWDSDF